MIYCLNTSRRIEAATRLNRRFSKSRLMLCSPRIKGSWLYSGCSSWVPRSTALTISSSSGDWTYPLALMKMHSNGSSLTSQVGDNTYATTVGRLKYPWLNAAYLKARCSDRCISSFLQQMSSASLTSTARWRARLRYSRICRWHADLRPLCRRRHAPPHIQACRLHRQYRGLDDEQLTRAQCVKNQIHLVWFGSSFGQVYVWVDRDQRVLHSSIQDRSRPGSVFESGISRHQADQYIVLSHTSAAYDPSNAHQWCMPRSRQGPRSSEAGLLQWAPCQSTGLSSGSTVRYDACCSKTHPPATSKKSRFWRHPSPAPLAWHLEACSFQTMRSRASVHSRVGSFIPF